MMLTTPKPLRVKPLAKDFTVGCLHMYIIVAWMIVLASVASNTTATTLISMDRDDSCYKMCQDSSVSLTLRNRPNLEGLCPENGISFLCQTTETSTHSWTSKEYITGNALQFGTFYSPPLSHGSRAMATLISTIQNNTVITSELILTLDANISSATVTCNADDRLDCNCSISFRLLDEPDIPQNVIIEESPDSESTDDSCTLDIQLDHPSNYMDGSYIYRYRVDHPSGSRLISADGTDQIKLHNCTRDLRLNITALVCGGSIVGATASDNEPKFIPDPVSSTTYAESTQPQFPTSGGLEAGAIMGIVIGVLIIAIAIMVIVMVIIIIIFKGKCAKTDTKELPKELREFDHEAVPMLETASKGSTLDHHAEEPYAVLERRHNKPEPKAGSVYQDPSHKQERSNKGQPQPQNKTGELYAMPDKSKKQAQPTYAQLLEPGREQSQPKNSHDQVMYATVAVESISIEHSPVVQSAGTTQEVMSDVPVPKPMSDDLIKNILALVKEEVQRLLSERTAKQAGNLEQEEKTKLLENDDTNDGTD